MPPKYPVTEAWEETLTNLINYMNQVFKTIQSNKTLIKRNVILSPDFRNLNNTYESDFNAMDKIFCKINDWITDEVQRPIAIEQLKKYIKQTQNTKILLDQFKPNNDDSKYQ